MNRFLATALLAGMVAVPIAATHASPVTGRQSMVRVDLPQDTSKKGRKGKGGRERHPELARARRSLMAAKSALQSADTDFGGHRVAALKSIDEALEHIKEAEAFDKK